MSLINNLQNANQHPEGKDNTANCDNNSAAPERLLNSSLDFKVNLASPFAGVPCFMIFQYLQIFDAMAFAICERFCLKAFIAFVDVIPKTRQSKYKSFALRCFVLNTVNLDLYPSEYLHELKQIDTRISSVHEMEFHYKLRKSLFAGDIRTLSILIDFGVNVNAITNDILKNGAHFKIGILQRILSAPQMDVNALCYKNKFTIAAAAVFLNKYDVWKVLYSASDVDWNFVDTDGRNLAYWSVCVYKGNCMQFLKMCQAKKVDFALADHFGNNAAMMAVRHRKLLVLQYLIGDRKVSVNWTNKNGVSLAHECACRGFADILQYLILQKADMHATNADNDTPIDIIKFYHYKECIRLLQTHNLWIVDQ